MASADKKSSEFAARREELKALSAEVKGLEGELGALEKELEALLVGIPNLPDPSTPIGKSEEDNVVVHTWGNKPDQPFEVKPTGTSARIWASSISSEPPSSPVPLRVARGAGARLERALINYMLDLHTREHGYVEVLPPFLVKDSALFRHRAAAQVRRRPVQDAQERSRQELRPVPNPHAEVRSPISTRRRSSKERSCPWPTPPTRLVFAARPAAMARTCAA